MPRTLLLVLILASLLSAQVVAQPPSTVQTVTISNITSQNIIIDNRSSQRQSYYNGFCATGTGSWSVTIQYSDVSTAGPWNSFADADATVNNSAASCIGASSGYHQYLRFSVTGSVSINYTGTKSIYIPTTGGGGGGGGSPAFNSITTGTNGSATMTVGTGASLTFSGSGVVNANQLVGTPISGLTGIIKMTSGVPSISTSANVIALWSGTCSSSTFLRGDGSCQVPTGGGGGVSNVNATGTGIFAFTGGPITSSGTLTMTQTGVSGGIPYFSNTSTLSSSSALNTNQLILGGGAGMAPVALGSLGTAATLYHGNASGPGSFGSVVNADIAGATIDVTTKITGIVPSANGGTNSSFIQFTGPASSVKSFTLPNVNAAILTDAAAVTVPQGGVGLTTIPPHALLIGNGTGAATLLAAGAVGTCLTGTGATSDPGYVPCPGVTGPGGATNALQKNNGSGGFAGSSITDNGSTVSTTEPINAPSLSSGSAPPAVTAGTGGVPFACAEGTAPSVGAAVGVDVLYCDSAQHGPLLSNNNGSYLPLIQGPASTTSGAIPTWNSTNGGLLGAGITLGMGVATALAANVSGSGAICLVTASSCSTTTNQGIRTIGASFGSFQSGATALVAGATACVPTYFGGTIQAVEVIGDVSGTATFNVLTVAHGSWTGIGSASSISSGTFTMTTAARYTDTTLSMWTTSLSAGTDVCFAMTSPSSVAGLSISLKVSAN